MTDMNKTPQQGEGAASHPLDSQESGHTGVAGGASKRKLYFALAAFICVVVAFGAMRLGKMSGFGAGQEKPRCTAKYTPCVLDCNRKSVAYSQKSESSTKPKEKSMWEQRLNQVQTRCIPGCYQVHCLGKSPKLDIKKGTKK